MGEAMGAIQHKGMQHKGMQQDAAPRRRGITGNTLKWIAVIAMIIDHTAAIILERILMQNGAGNIVDAEAASMFLEQNAVLYYTNFVMRIIIGRLSFPIFCFLIIEGFLYTHNVKKYIGRLALFAIISEIPFDLAFSGEFIAWGYQNVFFTLLIGLLVITGFRFVEQKREWNKVLRLFLYLIIIAAGCAAATYLKTDYSMIGVLTIVVMYLFKENKMGAACVGCGTLTLMSLTEITTFLSLIPIYLYNKERGKGNRWFFYVFYPLHILILYLIAYAMGLGDIVLRMGV